MKRNNFWRWVIVVFVLVWALFELNPPNDQPLIDVFEQTALNKDERFTAIVKQAREGAAGSQSSAYELLLAAAGSTPLTNYFPIYNPDPDVNANKYVLTRIQRTAAGKIRLGIDLKGGTSLRLGMDMTGLRTTPESTNAVAGTNSQATDALELTYKREAALSQAVKVLHRRVDALGVAEPVIQPVGEDQIIVQLPGLSASAMESAKATVQRAAFLEFRLVHDRSAELIREGLIEPGYERMTEVNVSKTGEKIFTDLLVSKRRTAGTIDGKRVELTGSNVKSARVDLGQFTGQPEISFELDSVGAQLFGQITTENVGRSLAIILDGKLASAPEIKEPILGGQCRISGSYTREEAVELANVLENPLQAPLNLLSEHLVDPTLGADTIASGIRAAMYGLIFVSVFMLVYYLLGGVIANAALILNVIILLAVMSQIGATLTLPGIAGIVLTVGMAVDANVLIFERMREELAAGKSLRGAINAGYDRAFVTILDSNITTLIASVVLIALGTGSIKGFGYTLTIGIAVSMFTSLVFTRLIFDSLLNSGKLKRLRMMSLIHKTKFDFLKLAKPAFIVSWLIILSGIGYGVYSGSKAVNHEFKGGVEVTFSFKTKPDQDKVSATVRQAIGSEPSVQFQRNVAAGNETLVVKSELLSDPTITSETELIERTAKLVADTLTKEYASAELKVVNRQLSGPSVGAEVQQSALISVLIALFGILVYVAFRYEFSFAVGAVVAVIHDVLMTVGIYFLAGYQLSSPMIAALMTIIGFSINDTIVIFDRIREDLQLGVRGSFKDLINIALNQTLSRTIITSGTVFLSTLALYLFGGGGLGDFSFALLIGIISGTYSTIYIASAIVLWWHKGQRPTLAASAPAEPAATPAAPARA